MVEDSHINCRDLFVLQNLLHTRYAPHLERPQFSDLIAECKKIFGGMMKILKSKAVEVVEDPKPKPEVDDKPEPRPEVAELVSPQEGIFFQPTKLKSSLLTLVDLSAC